MNGPDSVLVSFIPDCDILDVQPPFYKGRRESIWIRLYGKPATNKDIIERAKVKLDICYGLTASDYQVNR